MSYRPFARLAGLSLAGVFLLGCDVTDTPNRTGRSWLEETGVAFSEPFTIRVPIELDSMWSEAGGAFGEGNTVYPGGYEQYAGSFEGITAEWRSVFRPGKEGDWAGTDSLKRDTTLLRNENAIWSLHIVLDTLNPTSAGVRLRLGLRVIDAVTGDDVDSLIRTGSLPNASLDTVITIPRNVFEFLPTLPASWAAALRALRDDSTKVAAFSLAVDDPNSGMLRIYRHAFLRVQRFTTDTSTVPAAKDSLLPALMASSGGLRAFGTRMTWPSFGRSEPVMYTGARSRILAFTIDTAKFRSAVRARLPAGLRADARYQDPFAQGLGKFAVLGARLELAIGDAVLEGGRSHGMKLFSRGDTTLGAGVRSFALAIGDTVRPPLDGNDQPTLVISASARGSQIVLRVEDPDDTSFYSIVRFDQGETEPLTFNSHGFLWTATRGGDSLRLDLVDEPLGTRIETQTLDTAKGLRSAIGSGASKVDLQARVAFSRMFTRTGSKQSIVLGLGIRPLALDPAANGSYPSSSLRTFINSFSRARLTTDPLGEAVIVLQPLGSKGRN